MAWASSGGRRSTSTSTPSPSTARTPWSRSTTSPSEADARREYWHSWPKTRKRVFCYANGELRKDQQNDEIIRFVDFWKQRTGRLAEELIFDSKLTTYANLSKLNRMGIEFITLRRRSQKLLDELARTPASAWRRIELESTSRAYKTPRVLDRRIRLKDYDGPLRQLTVTDLGHEQPTLLLTNQLDRAASQLIGRYAQRMLIENNIEDGIDFFHMDALS